MFRFLLLFLIPPIPVYAVELLRDRHADKEYVFEADQSETAATVDAAEVTARATDWATHFYKDLLHIENGEFRHKPPRLWLVTFVRSKQRGSSNSRGGDRDAFPCQDQ
jgi:hypothetical protein